MLRVFIGEKGVQKVKFHQAVLKHQVLQNIIVPDPKTTGYLPAFEQPLSCSL